MLTLKEKEYLAMEIESRIKEYVGVNIYKSCLETLDEVDISDENIEYLTLNYQLKWPVSEMREILKSYQKGKGIARPLSLPVGEF